jgi:hypothetical protein
MCEVVKGRQRGGLPTYAFFLDLSKEYDTVWRDGLLYKLWHKGNKGIRGPTWQYIVTRHVHQYCPLGQMW